MAWKDTYEEWTQFTGLDEALKDKLAELKDNEEQLEDSFYTNLTFGTGGMRGKIGPGPNRMNIYTVRKAAEGLAKYIKLNGEEAMNRGAVIAYDSRHFSPEFAMETAKTLGNHGIQSYVFESLRTTPELSFAVRYLHAYSGVMITASHNPSIYNGFKVYGNDGAQFASEEADMLVEQVNGIENELEIAVQSEEALKQSGLLQMIGEKVDHAYLQQLQTIVIDKELLDESASDLSIVYTPLHGTGNRPVREGLTEAGFTNVHVVGKQALPDGDFPTVTYPNPEEDTAFELSMKEGKEVGADILMATDPDADRVGIAVDNGTDYKLLTGNQVGAILLYYIIKQRIRKGTLPDNPMMIKTIVTSELGKDIASAHDIETMDVLTGFKYIAEKIRGFEESQDRSFLFGYEESYGYLISDFVRDKDAVQTCLLISEAATYYKTKGQTLLQVLDEIYETYGYYFETLESLALEGKAGVEKIEHILTAFRNESITKIAGKKVLIKEDYLSSVREEVLTGKTETIDLPTSNVLKYKLEDGAWFCLRPSGTEPKIKFYFGVKEVSEKESETMIKKLKTNVMDKVNEIVR